MSLCPVFMTDVSGKTQVSGTQRMTWVIVVFFHQRKDVTESNRNICHDQHPSWSPTFLATSPSTSITLSHRLACAGNHWHCLRSHLRGSSGEKLDLMLGLSLSRWSPGGRHLSTGAEWLPATELEECVQGSARKSHTHERRHGPYLVSRTAAFSHNPLFFATAVPPLPAFIVLVALKLFIFRICQKHVFQFQTLKQKWQLLYKKLLANNSN